MRAVLLFTFLSVTLGCAPFHPPKPSPINGTWKNYETAPVPIGQIDRLFYTPIVEFDENRIIYYQKTSS